MLDLFCGEGGAARGYVNAGWEVHGVDSNPKLAKRYLASGATSFTVADASEYPITFMFDAVHASPPCEDHSPTMGFGLKERGTAWLLPHTVARLQASGLPYIIENVESAAVKRHMPGAMCLCGSMYGLGARDSRGQYRVLRRHRLFLTSFGAVAPGPCKCDGVLVGGVFGHGEQGVNGGRGYGFAADSARRAMGTPWMTRDGCAESIPPAYTYDLGMQLAAVV